MLDPYGRVEYTQKMSKINERLVDIRAALGRRQGEFARGMGLRQSTWADIEAGRNPVADRYVRLVCLTYGVREEWLRTGEGDMLDEEAMLSERERRLLDLYRRLSPRARPLLVEYAHKLLSDEQSLRVQAGSDEQAGGMIAPRPIHEQERT